MLWIIVDKSDPPGEDLVTGGFAVDLYVIPTALIPMFVSVLALEAMAVVAIEETATDGTSRMLRRPDRSGARATVEGMITTGFARMRASALFHRVKDFAVLFRRQMSQFRIELRFRFGIPAAAVLPSSIDQFVQSPSEGSLSA
jgi:hypothetical protein